MLLCCVIIEIFLAYLPSFGLKINTSPAYCNLSQSWIVLVVVSSLLFSDSDRLVAQGNLISFDPEEGSRNRANVSQDRIVSTSQAQMVQEGSSQGIQTSPVMEASPVQHIQDVYGSPSREDYLTQHRVEKKVLFCKKEKNVDFHKLLRIILSPSFPRLIEIDLIQKRLVYGNHS